MKLSRRLLSLVLCFSVCLIGCAVPALAVNSTARMDKGFMYFRDSSKYQYPFEGSPTKVIFTNDTFTSRYTLKAATFRCCDSSTYLQFIINLVNPVELNLTDVEMSIVVTTSSGGNPRDPSGLPTTTLAIDGSVVDTVTGLNGETLSYSGTAESQIRLRSYRGASSFNSSFTVQNNSLMDLVVKLPGLDSALSGGGDIGKLLDSIEIQTGYIENIDGNVTDILDSVNNIETVVSSVQLDVADIKQQLETPSSNIWQAAGQTIKDAVTSLFVPSQQDIQQVKQQFDQLAQDKLGGAYTAMETVDNTVTQVNNKLNNPSAQQGINFPGIAVPLGGEVGTVTIAQPQVVTLPTQLTAILHPVASIIIPIICGLGTFNTMKDIVECFLSGYSYSEYLHRDKGGGDE